MEEHDYHLEQLRSGKEPQHPRFYKIIRDIIGIQKKIKPEYPSLHINTPEELNHYPIESLVEYRTHLRRVESATKIASSCSTQTPRRWRWIPFIAGAVLSAVLSSILVVFII